MAIVCDKHLTDEVIAKAFENTNFGRDDYRTILAETVMKRAAGYHSGGTATAICMRLGLLSEKNQSATKLGLTMAFHHYYRPVVRDAINAAQLRAGDIMKPLSERIKEFPNNQFVEWLCLACVDVREVRTPNDAQEEINKIRDAVTERFAMLEDKLRIKQNHIRLRDSYIEELEERAVAAEAKLELVRGQRDSELNRNTELEAKLAELEKQEPVAWHIYQWRDSPKGWDWYLTKSFSSQPKIGDGWKSVPLFTRSAPAINLAELVPDGWKLVPVEPTESMIVDGFESRPDEDFSEPEVWEAYQMMSGCQQAAYKARLCWLAMLAAAPSPHE